MAFGSLNELVMDNYLDLHVGYCWILSAQDEISPGYTKMTCCSLFGSSILTAHTKATEFALCVVAERRWVIHGRICRSDDWSWRCKHPIYLTEIDDNSCGCPGWEQRWSYCGAPFDQFQIRCRKPWLLRPAPAMAYNGRHNLTEQPTVVREPRLKSALAAGVNPSGRYDCEIR